MPRVAVAIHNIEEVFRSVENGTYNLLIQEEISLSTLSKAIYFVEVLEEQKELFSSVSIIPGILYRFLNIFSSYMVILERCIT